MQAGPVLLTIKNPVPILYGKAGSLITKEAIGRDYEVTAIVKPGTSARVPEGCAILEVILQNLHAVNIFHHTLSIGHTSQGVIIM